jgi:hypothetical protein
MAQALLRMGCFSRTIRRIEANVIAQLVADRSA